ncbi:MAG: hypothetical protein V4662_13630 [Verrucomicrobiota bacterium]
MATTGQHYTHVIGMTPPGIGETPTVVRIGPPRISRNDKDWDVMEESLWMKDFTIIAPGANRSGVTQFTTDRFIVDSVKVLRYMAGYPVAQVISKGWAGTKAARWDFRRNVTGDANSFNLGGQAYAIATEFQSSLPSGIYNAAGSPGAIPAQRWGMVNAVTTPGSFVPLQGSWGAYYQPGSVGWYIAGREVDTLADGATSKFVTTYACYMYTNGTAPV